MPNGAKKREYNATVKRLQSQADHLLLLAQQEQQTLESQTDNQRLLAEAILQHKIMFELLKPLQARWLQPQPHSGPQQGSWLSDLQRLTCSSDWSSALALAATTNPTLQPMLMVPAEQLEVCAKLTVEDARHMTEMGFNKLLLLLELLAPERYPAALVSTTAHTALSAAASSTPGSTPDSTAAGGSSSQESGAAPAADEDPLQPNLEQAAAELLANLQELKDTIGALLIPSLILVLHNQGILFTLADTNMATGERCTPPSSHYVQAARRVRLTARQIKQLQILLKQYNRMARQQHDAGRQLVDLSEHSFSLQASLAARDGEAQPSTPSSAAATHSDRLGDHESPGFVEGTWLEHLLQQHVLDRADLMVVMSIWGVSSLTYMQMAQHFLACWPHFHYLPSLVELSPFLTPDDSPQLTINASVCEAAAKAAALADEVGYTGAQGFMQRRCEAMDLQVQWVLQHIQRQP